MKKSELEQIIREEITTVITENLFKSLVTAGIKLFSKIRGGAVITSTQRTGLVRSLGKDALKAKRADIKPLLDDLKKIRGQLISNDKLITSEKLIRSLDLKKFPGFKSELGKKGFSMSYLDIDAISKFLRIVDANKFRYLGGVGAGTLGAGLKKLDVSFPPAEQI